MKNIIFFIFLSININAQVGINTNNPKSTLHIDALNPTTPESMAGLGIPVYSKFPKDNPTILQNGMLIFLDNSNSSYVRGFYFWNADANSWEYIVDFSSEELDISKIQVVATSLKTPITGAGIKSSIIPFGDVSSVDPSFTLSDGGLKIGKTSNYHIQLTGGVYKTVNNNVNIYTVEILVNNTVNNQLVASNSAPGGTLLGRSTVFYISSVLKLNKNDVLSLKITRNTGGSNIVTVETPFNLTISKLD